MFNDVCFAAKKFYRVSGETRLWRLTMHTQPRVMAVMIKAIQRERGSILGKDRMGKNIYNSKMS